MGDVFAPPMWSVPTVKMYHLLSVDLTCRCDRPKLLLIVVQRGFSVELQVTNVEVTNLVADFGFFVCLTDFNLFLALRANHVFLLLTRGSLYYTKAKPPYLGV